MQAKISAFFKPSSPKFPDASQTSGAINDVEFSEINEPEILITYKRRIPKEEDSLRNNEADSVEISETPLVACGKPPSTSARILNKKRSYAQFHLELGQSNFLLHTCSTCGLKYAHGEEGDEKVHKEFHKNHTHGIQFKGWSNERLISVKLIEGNRIVLVLDGDPPAQMNKVQEVVKMVEGELELSEGWLLHKLCKVYLFVSTKRIAGCLVAEPIKTAYRVISSSVAQGNSHGTTAKASRSNSAVLRFGNVDLQREVIKSVPTVNRLGQNTVGPNGIIHCEKEVVPALCGIRAIWVTPSNRRKHIATKLLDAVRKSFCMGYVLENSQLAFSQPTSSGRALASRYSGTESFLVYMDEFAIGLGRHFTTFYQQVTAAIIKILEKPWERSTGDGQPHKHGFQLGSEKHITEVTVKKSGALRVTSGIEGLALLKTTQSGFEGFIRDKYTALPETRERMLATEVSATWRYPFESLSSIPVKPLYFSESYMNVKKVLVETFFGPPKEGVYSPSVQSTLYHMARAVLSRFPDIASIQLRMPNLHFLPVNLPGKDNPTIVKFADDVFAPIDEPHGTIEASLSRSLSKM